MAGTRAPDPGLDTAQGAAAALRARAVRARYDAAPPGVRSYVAAKLALDPMFRRLGELAQRALADTPCREAGPRVLDVGAGVGLPLCWLADVLPRLHGVAMEPNLERSRAAREALGTAFRVTASAAPNLPLEPAAFELVLLLDVAHYLDDATLEATLARARVCLRPRGALHQRDTVKSRLFSMERGVETLIMWRRGQATHFRAARELTSAVVSAGFAVDAEPIPGREETWFVARRA